eukprot:3912938-Alexandrium_andersonii.AAC.1
MAPASLSRCSDRGKTSLPARAGLAWSASAPQQAQDDWGPPAWALGPQFPHRPLRPARSSTLLLACAAADAKRRSQLAPPFPPALSGSLM